MGRCALALIILLGAVVFGWTLQALKKSDIRGPARYHRYCHANRPPAPLSFGQSKEYAAVLRVDHGQCTVVKSYSVQRHTRSEVEDEPHKIVHETDMGARTQDLVIPVVIAVADELERGRVVNTQGHWREMRLHGMRNESRSLINPPAQDRPPPPQVSTAVCVPTPPWRAGSKCQPPVPPTFARCRPPAL